HALLHRGARSRSCGALRRRKRRSVWPWLPLPRPPNGQALVSVVDLTSLAGLSVGVTESRLGSAVLFLNSSCRSVVARRNSRIALPIAPPTSGSFPGP